MAVLLSNFILLFLIFLLECQISSLYRVSEKIYDKLQGNTACFKRLNGTNEIGCTSKFYGNVGVVHLIENDTDIKWVIERGPHSPYMLALTPQHFTQDVLSKAWNSGKISGAVLLSKYVPSSFTGDHTCPNRESSFYLNTTYSDYCEQHPWNPYGSSFYYANWEFPIFLLDDEESIQKTLNCFYDFNQPDELGNPRDWPLCSMELKSNMYATTNSEVCIRRSKHSVFLAGVSFCDPLEDYNIWTSLHPLNYTDGPKEESIILISTSADASSQFDNRSPGADAAVSGLVTLLATAEALSNQKNLEESKNVIFVIFQGESWDYIGSSRMVYDMQENKFPSQAKEDQVDQMSPINMSHIDSIIDIRQVGLSTDGLFIHSDPLSNEIPSINEKTQALIELLKNTSDNWKMTFQKVDTTMPLPPSSLQSFLKVKNISGVFISDHEREYKNNYYQSIFDDYRNLNYTSTNESDDQVSEVSVNIAETASVLASSVYSLVNGNAKDISANQSLVDTLLYCYLKNINCSFFRQICDKDLLKYLYSGPAKMYISIMHENYLPLITGRILAYLTGEIDRDYDEKNCTGNNTQVFYLTYYPFMDDGVCIRSTVHYTRALSPAFIADDYDWGSGQYSTWTESTWQSTGARIFLRPSVTSEIGLILCGLLCLSLSLIVVYFLNSRSSILFTSDIPPAPI